MVGLGRHIREGQHLFPGIPITLQVVPESACRTLCQAIDLRYTRGVEGAVALLCHIKFSDELLAGLHAFTVSKSYQTYNRFAEFFPLPGGWGPPAPFPPLKVSQSFTSSGHELRHGLGFDMERADQPEGFSLLRVPAAFDGDTRRFPPRHPAAPDGDGRRTVPG